MSEYRLFASTIAAALFWFASPASAQLVIAGDEDEPPPPPVKKLPPPQPRRALPPPTLTYHALFVNGLSFQAGRTQVTGSDADDRTMGYRFALRQDQLYTRGAWTARLHMEGTIGGGTGGLEGSLRLAAAGGAWGEVGERHGPFARLGYAVEFQGNDKLYRSSLRIPELQLGYQLNHDTTWFEFGGVGSLVLAGRYNTGDHARRELGFAPTAGGFATVQVDGARVNFTLERIFTSTGPETPVDQLRGDMCLEPFTAIVLCGHGQLHVGEVELPGGSFQTSRATYFGGSIAFGVIRAPAAMRREAEREEERKRMERELKRSQSPGMPPPAQPNPLRPIPR